MKVIIILTKFSDMRPSDANRSRETQPMCGLCCCLLFLTETEGLTPKKQQWQGNWGRDATMDQQGDKIRSCDYVSLSAWPMAVQQIW